MGDALADEVQRVLAEHDISVDVVIPVSGEYRSIGSPFPNRALCPGTGYISCCRVKSRSEIKPPLPRRVHQESICWTNVHYAWTANEVGGPHPDSYLSLDVLSGVKMSAKS